ncbi:hypothetical protein EL18_01160 [Nitratireductor basaltis]|uniref:Anti-sigma factor NepR domain-containing protein n=2 Tax=Nitratireductor basaltis TaxID=472175 RepID=A0A084UAZ4_9HYPH|nr:hypothetical protein EL18_01160 [Nitratireductor basaltis]
MDKPISPPTDAKLDNEVQLLLRDIEKEAIPERLMELALKLQEALAAARYSDDGEATHDR